ncbi:MAG: tRNA lysidine(34) synthetase TilS [Deltaproteobacteria bacterium]
MLPRGAIVVAGVSGGIDSMAMLHVLVRLKGRYGLELKVCHLNHNLRGSESRRDYDFVRGFCGENGLGFIGRTLRKGRLKDLKKTSLQEAARNERLKFLNEIALKLGAGVVALGHTLDDQAETALMRFVKGSSLSGLSGIPATRDKFVRPLIDVSRAEIEGYARENNIPYVVDSSNLKTDYLRNKLRLRLIPYIRRNFNPNIISTIARSSASLKEDNDFIEGVAEDEFKNAVMRQESGLIILNNATIAKMHDAIKARVFLKAARALSGKAGDLDFLSVHVAAFLGLVRGKRPNARLDTAHGIKVKREYEKLILAAHPERESECFEARLNVPGTTVLKREGLVFNARVQKTRPKDLGKNNDCAYFDYDRVKPPIVARSFMRGDSIVPLGMKGHKKIKEIFIEKKIPRGERGRIPVLVSGGEIMCIAGIKESEVFKLKGHTKKILRIEWKRRRSLDAL